MNSDLTQLFADVLAITPRGSVPFVTNTASGLCSYGAIVVDQHSRPIAVATASTRQGVVDLIAARLPAGRGEVLA